MNVVLLEDLAAVLGVAVCSTCMGLTHIYGSHIPDAVGSLLVGGLLGGVASFIIYSNVAGLVGRSVFVFNLLSSLLCFLLLFFGVWLLNEIFLPYCAGLFHMTSLRKLTPSWNQILWLEQFMTLRVLIWETS